MKQIIEERIEQINFGIIPNGYKKTAVGIVPIEWEETELSQIFNFKNGLNKEKEAFGKGTPIVNYVDVWKRRGLRSKDLLGKVELSKKEIENYNVKKGDVFFTRTSETKNEIGFSSVMLDDVVDTVFSGFVLRARPYKNKIVDEYNQYCYSSALMRHEIIRKSSITTRALTNGTLLGEVQINLPSKPEQQKIADILSNWNEAIDLQEKLLTKLSIKKKALLQKLLKPNSEWKKTRLGNCVRVQNGFAFKSDEFSDTGFPVVRISNISDQKIDLNDCVYYSGTNIKNEFRITKGDVLIAMSGATTGKIGIYDYDYDAYLNQRVGKFVLTNKNYSYGFIKQILSSVLFENKLKDLLVTGAQPNISHTDIENIYFDFPDIKHQNKIAQVLSQYDELYNLEHNYLNRLKIQYKSMQQLLLTGIVRVN